VKCIAEGTKWSESSEVYGGGGFVCLLGSKCACLLGQECGGVSVG
jgi:hypothetical protein